MSSTSSASMHAFAVPLVQAVSDSQVTARVTVGAFALLIFDIIVTFDQEVTYVWRAPWSLGKGAYLCSRYIAVVNLCLFVILALSGNPSPMLCDFGKWYRTIWTLLSAFVPCNIILASRLQALYSHSKRVRIVILALFIIGTLTHIALMIILDVRLSSPVASHGFFLGCVNQLNGASVYNIVVTLPDLVLACIYFGLALNRFLGHWRERIDLKHLQTIRDSKCLASLFSLLYRDGVLVYATIFVTVFINGVLVVSMPMRIVQGAGLPWLIAIMAMASCRLIFMLGGRPDAGIYKTEAEYRVDIYDESCDSAASVGKIHDTQVGSLNVKHLPQWKTMDIVHVDRPILPLY